MRRRERGGRRRARERAAGRRVGVPLLAPQPFESRSLGEELVHAAHHVEAGEHVAVHALFVVLEELARPRGAYSEAIASVLQVAATCGAALARLVLVEEDDAAVVHQLPQDGLARDGLVLPVAGRKVPVAPDDEAARARLGREARRLRPPLRDLRVDRGVVAEVERPRRGPAADEAHELAPVAARAAKQPVRNALQRLLTPAEGAPPHFDAILVEVFFAQHLQVLGPDPEIPAEVGRVASPVRARLGAREVLQCLLIPAPHAPDGRAGGGGHGRAGTGGRAHEGSHTRAAKRWSNDGWHT